MAVHHFNVPVAPDVSDRFMVLHYTDWESLNGRNINNWVLGGGDLQLSPFVTTVGLASTATRREAANVVMPKRRCKLFVTPRDVLCVLCDALLYNLAHCRLFPLWPSIIESDIFNV